MSRYTKPEPDFVYIGFCTLVVLAIVGAVLGITISFPEIINGCYVIGWR